ncbi:MAG TPA: hypothetical protein PKD28_00360 [Candidatus Saccharibacteria bacterium]|nr:hypothetical protein [Candidatus Saccharibacteria bacterium]
MKHRFDTPTITQSETAPSRRFTLPQSENARERRRNVRNLVILGGVATAAIFGLNHLSNEDRAGGDASNETLNPDIVSIQVDNGATIRSDPHKRDGDTSNRLDQIDLGDGRYVTVPTEEGVRIAHDENGTWYGLSANDLTDIVNIDISDDRDGIVWINEQRASANTDTSEE